MFYAVATDKFMSHTTWSGGRVNYYVVECDSVDKLETALSNMRDRTDMIRVRACKKMPHTTSRVLVSIAKEYHSFFTPNAFRK